MNVYKAIKPIGLIAALALSALSACAPTSATRVAQAGDATELKTLTPRQLWQRLHSGSKLSIFDNNRPETYALGRVPGALLLSLSGDIAAHLPADKGATLVFYCSNEH